VPYGRLVKRTAMAFQCPTLTLRSCQILASISMTSWRRLQEYLMGFELAGRESRNLPSQSLGCVLYTRMDKFGSLSWLPKVAEVATLRTGPPKRRAVNVLDELLDLLVTSSQDP
jgi:hypothetical protein